jgi:hypothetical protein
MRPGPVTTTVVLAAVVVASCSSGGGRSLGAFCQARRAIGDPAAGYARLVASSDPAKVRQGLERLRNLAERTRRAAPDDIRADAEKSARALEQFVAVALGLRDPANPTPDEARQLAEAFRKVRTPEFQQAAEHVAAYGAQKCGEPRTSSTVTPSTARPASTSPTSPTPPAPTTARRGG